MILAEEIIDAALTEVAYFFDPGTTAPSIWIRRLNMRQEEIFARSNTINRDYFGTCAKVPLVNGAANLRTLIEAPDSPERPDSPDIIDRVEVLDPGDSEYEVGQRINLVRIDEIEAALPPRMTLRDYVFWPIGNELAGVVTIRVHYARRPRPIRKPEDPIELTGAHSELLVWDLARYAASRAPGINPDVRESAIRFFTDQEARALELFDAHVQQFASTLQTRFA